MVIYPKVSILLTSYNNEMVRDAIKGVLAQTYKNWELIILDDNSNQKILDIYKEFDDEFSHQRIKFYNSHIREKDRLKVCPYARQINVGLKMATGKIVMYLTDDTVYKPNKLKEVVRYFRWHPRVRVVYNRQEQRKGKLSKVLSPDRVLKRAFCRVDHSSVSHYMSCVKEVGDWDTKSFGMADAYYWNKLNSKYLFYPIKKILETNYIHKNSFSHLVVKKNL